MISILSADTYEKNLIMANIISNPSDAVPELNVEFNHECDRTEGIVVSLSSIIPNLLFLEV